MRPAATVRPADQLVAGVDKKRSSFVRRPFPAVYLVGAGPGDAGLLTQAGAAALQRAAVVLYDALVNPVLLNYCPDDAEKLFVGKTAGRHSLTQDQINTLLVEKGRQIAADPHCVERVVVRLKGGDPYVFGRGAEEGQVLARSGVTFAVIPGVTAGIAAAAYAGIPVTHRAFTDTVTFVTGHLAASHDDSDTGTTGAAPQIFPAGDVQAAARPLRYKALAALGGTLVFYMGVKSLPEITAKLQAAGLDPDTPAAVIAQGTWPQQKTLISTLAKVAAAAQKAGLQAPAITVIGTVVQLRERLNWFENRPLFGQTVLVTRTRPQASELAARLTALGARVIEAPTIALAAAADYAAVDQALARLHRYHCVVFTSAAGVEATWQRLARLHLDARAFPRRVAAIGPATAAALKVIGIRADLIPEEFISAQLSAQLLQRLADKGDFRGRHFLLLRSALADPLLAQQLMRAGAVVEDLPIYQTITPDSLPPEAIHALRNGEVTCLTFTSASTAKNLHALLPEELRAAVTRCRRISIGPVTSAALRDLGWPATAEASPHSIAGMIEALIACASDFRNT